MEKITELCTGCRVCEQLCGKGAISLKADLEGFLQATIDTAKCVDCGLCVKRCPQNVTVEKQEPIKVIAVRYKDDAVLYDSASGGAFAGMAKYVLSKGGTVFGVAYDDDWNAGHIAVTTGKELGLLQSSKYVQADTRNSYTEVKALLRDGQLVLYSGTGCQIAGLKVFLKHDYDNLLTMDLICHGVSSPLLFRKYVEWLGRKYGGKIIYYDFRDKSGGWGLGYKSRVNTKTRTKTRFSFLDPYYYHFLKGDTYRECCYHCHYCTKGRVGDITIGDYWGIEKEHPGFFSTKGVSVMLLNTERGVEYFRGCENMFHICESTFEQAARKNHNLLEPTKRNSIRDGIYDSMDDSDYFDTVLDYPRSMKAHIKGMMPMWMKLFIKKAFR